jgi:hypothetical protein
MSEKSSNKLLSPKTGVVMMLVAPVFAILPLIGIPLGNLFCGPDKDEMSCSWGVLPWYVLFTLPAGFVLFVTGIVVVIISLVQKTGSEKDV